MHIDCLKDYIPAKYLPVFLDRGITTLGEAQCVALDAGILSGEDLVVSAPTSSGKTFLAELVACKHAGHGLTAILVSHRALAFEVFTTFHEQYRRGSTPLLRAGISTGEEDTVHGSWDAYDVVVSTYERFYAALQASPRLLSRLSAVVVDELQTLGTEGRGATVELLLSLFRARKKEGASLHLVGLSATFPNADDVAEWLGSKHVSWDVREPPLEQEVWLPGQRRRAFAPYEEWELADLSIDTTDVGAIVQQLLAEGKGPVGVMATTRPKALEYVHSIAHRLPLLEADATDLVGELRGLGDNNEATATLLLGVVRGVGLHQRDLSREQRRAVEALFREGRLSALVATPTLVAGVNLPFRTIIYPSLLRFNGKVRQEVPIAVSEYVNGIGRAGRKGKHEAGTGIIVCMSEAEADANQEHLCLRMEDVGPQLAACSPEFLFLHMLPSHDYVSEQALLDRAASTYTARQYPGLRDELGAALPELLGDEQLARLWDVDDQELARSRVGAVVASTGLEPRLLLEAFDTLRAEVADDATRTSVISLLAALISTSGTAGGLPFKTRESVALGRAVDAEIAELLAVRLSPLQSMALGLLLSYLQPEVLSDELRARLGSRAGDRTQISGHVSRFLRGCASLLEEAAAKQFQGTINYWRTLADAAALEVPLLVVPFARVFATFPVRHLGLSRMTKLATDARGELGSALNLSEQQMIAAVGAAQVTPARESILKYLQGLTDADNRKQLAAAAGLGIHGMVERLFSLKGTQLEEAVMNGFNYLGWQLTAIDQKGSISLPDLTGTLPTNSPVTIECKASGEFVGEVSRKEVESCRKKFADAPEGLSLVVGRPVFSDEAIQFALGNTNRTPRLHLVTVGALVEMMFLRAQGKLSPEGSVSLIETYVYTDLPRLRDNLDRSGGVYD